MRTVIAMLALLFCSVAAAKEVSFTARPTAVKAGDTIKISFRVSAPTDVAVYVENSKGEVVRHLAAGVLGRSPPAPLKPNSLEQSVAWDGKDDRGKSATAGPFKVRVGLTLQPRFDRVIGFNPAAISSVRAIAVGPKGEVFVFFCFARLHPADNSMACSVFSREGKYLRTIMPYPANLPDEKLKGLKRIELEHGVKVPFLYQGETRSLVPGAGENENHDAVATADGRVAFVGRLEYTRYAQPGPIHLVVLNSDGSVPPDGPLKTRIFDRGVSATLAMSPDEKTLYASDVRTSKGHYGVPVNVVYRFGWQDAEAQPFLGGKRSAGDAAHRGSPRTADTGISDHRSQACTEVSKSALNDPKGICTDREGNLFIADKGNNRIAVFKPDGSFLGELKTTRPERVSVHRKTGVVYVLGGGNINEVLKFRSWRDEQPAARTTIPSFKHDGYRVSMAMDDSADPAVLWIGGHAGYYAHYDLLRIEDRGEAFGQAVDITRLPENKGCGAGPVSDVNLDRRREIVYVDRGPRYDGRTGKCDDVTVPIPRMSYKEGAVIACGLDDYIYLHSSGRQLGVYRFDREIKPAPFTGSDSNYIHNPGTLRIRSRGLTADPQGNVFVLWQKPKDQQSPGDAPDANALALYGPDGKARNLKLIDAEIRSLNSVRVDYQGNIYLLLGLRPGKDALPPGLKGKVPEGAKDPDAVLGVNYYPYIYGSIAKFGPEGGLIRQGCGGVECNYNVGLITEVKGAQWIVPGASNVPSWRTGKPYIKPDICLCESPRMDVDGFGRSFFPDAGRFRVGVLDTGGNPICTFGTYGNQDSAGPGSLVPVPEIPFCWVQAVAVGDEAAYVGDRLNRRVVRVKLSYAAEAACDIQ